MSASSSRTTSPPRSPAKGKQATADLLAKPSSDSSSLKASLRKETLASTTPGSGEVEIAQAGGKSQKQKQYMSCLKPQVDCMEQRRN